MPSITVNDRSLYYYTAGPDGPAAATILFIHGLGSSSSFYATITPTLASSYKCICMDTYGSGLSKLLDSQPENSIPRIAEDALGLLDVLAVKDKVIVVGHSMGGIVASEFAASNPDRVSAVILLGPVHPQPKIAEVFEQRIASVRKNGIEAFADSVPNAAPGKKAQPLHRAFIRALILGTEPEGYVSLCDCIAKAKPPRYADIKVPLLIIAGGEDQTAPKAGCQTILESYGTQKESKTLSELPGVGHWHCIEASTEVARLVQEFVSGL